MKLKDVHSFFSVLSRNIDFDLTVIITGGAAAIAFGVTRGTQDIDFEIELAVTSSQRQQAMAQLQTRLNHLEKETGIVAQFSEDIDRWSSIAIPYKRSKRLWKFETIDVRLLDPIVWAVGKLTRFHASDESDVVTVFKKKQPSARSVARAWGLALQKSPASNAQPLFRNNVENFFQRNAHHIWGKRTDPKKLFETFLKTARTPEKR